MLSCCLLHIHMQLPLLVFLSSFLFFLYLSYCLLSFCLFPKYSFWPAVFIPKVFLFASTVISQFCLFGNINLPLVLKNSFWKHNFSLKVFLFHHFFYMSFISILASMVSENNSAVYLIEDLLYVMNTFFLLSARVCFCLLISTV